MTVRLNITLPRRGRVAREMVEGISGTASGKAGYAKSSRAWWDDLSFADREDVARTVNNRTGSGYYPKWVSEVSYLELEPKFKAALKGIWQEARK